MRLTNQWLNVGIVDGESMHRNRQGTPQGNIVSPLLCNIYLHYVLDEWMDKTVRPLLNGECFIVRYADDFVILDTEREWLEKLASVLESYLETKLKLTLHPNKIVIRKIHQGIDFLGVVVFPTHIILRTKTKRRMLRKIKIRKRELKVGLIDKKSFSQSLQSYLGMLKHCRGRGIRNEINDILRG